MLHESSNINVYNRSLKRRHRVTLRVATPKRDSRKTQTATCANFIHQKDAIIAMNVVQRLKFSQNNNINDTPVYTVHDNFITTAQYANKIPKIYTDVIMNLGPPLRVINFFIYINLIQDLSPDYTRISDSFPHWLYEPIPIEDLKTLLAEIADKHLNKKNINSWNRNISVFINSYNAYVDTVCGTDFITPSEGGKLHTEKWEHYKAALSSWDQFPDNYSVHY